MKFFGIISYNIHCNFTNYGSALQSWAMSKAIDKIGNGRWESKLIDYCPEILKDKDPLNPMDHMWDSNEEARMMCELSLPAIRINYKKFDHFYHHEFKRSKKKYTKANFNDVVEEEELIGFVCGSDTIFCIDEFGFDDGFYANYPCMKNGYSVAFAASFGDPHFSKQDYNVLNQRLQNFKAIGLREKAMLNYVREHTSIPVEKVIDPTLLLEPSDYDVITDNRQENDKYLLLYARRYNKAMEDYAVKLAEQNGWKIIEISLRAVNSQKHKMFYEAGVQEFLSLVKYAECVITNSYHGMIFSVQFKKPFYVFSREQCDTKIEELLELFGIKDRLLVTGDEGTANEIDYSDVHARIAQARSKALEFMNYELENGYQGEH